MRWLLVHNGGYCNTQVASTFVDLGFCDDGSIAVGFLVWHGCSACVPCKQRRNETMEWVRRLTRGASPSRQSTRLQRLLSDGFHGIGVRLQHDVVRTHAHPVLLCAPLNFLLHVPHIHPHMLCGAGRHRAWSWSSYNLLLSLSSLLPSHLVHTKKSALAHTRNISTNSFFPSSFWPPKVHAHGLSLLWLMHPHMHSRAVCRLGV